MKKQYGLAEQAAWFIIPSLFANMKRNVGLGRQVFLSVEAEEGSKIYLVSDFLEGFRKAKTKFERGRRLFAPWLPICFFLVISNMNVH